MLAVLRTAVIPFEPMRATMADLICGAVPQRCPKIRLVNVEGGILRVASLLGFVDHWQHGHHPWTGPTLEELPSDDFKRKLWALFGDDAAGIVTYELVGVDRLMLGSDHLYIEGTFAASRRKLCGTLWVCRRTRYI